MKHGVGGIALSRLTSHDDTKMPAGHDSPEIAVQSIEKTI